MDRKWQDRSSKKLCCCGSYYEPGQNVWGTSMDALQLGGSPHFRGSLHLKMSIREVSSFQRVLYVLELES